MQRQSTTTTLVGLGSLSVSTLLSQATSREAESLTVSSNNIQGAIAWTYSILQEVSSILQEVL